MPLPDYGHFNMEKKTHQDLVFEMAPEIVSDDECDVINGKRVHRKRGKVTTGKIGIDLERKLIINEAEDPSVWRTVVDQKDIESARKYSAPERKVLKADVRKTLDSLISGSKLNSIKNVRRPSVTDAPPPSADYNKSVRFSLPKDNRQSEESVTGVSIQPSGTYRLGQRGSPGRTSVSPAKIVGATGSAPAKIVSGSSTLKAAPTPAIPSVGQRVDSRYESSSSSTAGRQSLSQAFHAKSQNSRPTPRASSYSYSEVSASRSFSTHGIRGLN